MRTATYNLNLRVGAGIPPIVKVSQNDEGRSIGFRLFDGALAFFPGATAEVTITGTKPSGLGFTETCSVSGSVAVVETTLAMTQESGQINAELRISDGTLDIGTTNFVLSVEPAPHPAGTTDGTTEEARTVLEQCAQYAQEAHEAASDVAPQVESLVDAAVADKMEEIEDAVQSVTDAATQAVSDITAAGEAVEESIPADYTALSTQVGTNATAISQLQAGLGAVDEGLSELSSELGFVPPECTMPDGYKSASYENSSATRGFKWVDNSLLMYFKVTSVGSQSASQVTIGNAHLTAGASLGFDLSTSDPILVGSYENTLSADANVSIVLRYYKSDYSSMKAAYLYLPVGTGEINEDVKALAIDNNIDISVYPKLIIQGVGSVTHTSTAVGIISVSIQGYLSEGGTTIVDEVNALKTRVTNLEEEMPDVSDDVYTSTSVIGNPFRFKPIYAHLFLNTVEDADIYVPSQSLYDIQISHRLGFDVIEVNTHKLTDGNYICLHGASGKFGLEFVSADGNSDSTVQNTDIESVNLEWVRSNVRYKAKYPKMRVSPPTLQEFLYECQKYHMIPLINYKGIDQVEIANGIVGKDNYIMYGAGKAVRNISNCILNTWSNLTTKEAILNWMDSVGNPCIVGCIHPENFTESEWYDIVESVHRKGGLIFYSAYISNTDQLKMEDYGFDGTGSMYKLPCTERGNLQNLSTPIDFSDFTVVDGTESDGQLTMLANGTVSPAQPESVKFLTGMWLDVTFVGSISISMGRFIGHSNCQSTSTASKTIRLSTYGMNIVPTFEIKALTNGTVIENIVFKVSEF